MLHRLAVFNLYIDGIILFLIEQPSRMIQMENYISPATFIAAFWGASLGCKAHQNPLPITMF